MGSCKQTAGSIRSLTWSALLFGVFAAAPSLSAQPAEASSWRGLDSPFSSEEEVVEFLNTARVVSQKRIRQGINQPYKVQLEKDGIQAAAVFRDVNVLIAKLEMNGALRSNFRDSSSFEVAAYQLNRLLGLNLVPPTVLRKIHGKKGSLQIWINQAMTEGERRNQNLSPPRPQEWALLRQIRWIFDALIHNDDRNLGNSLIDANWNLWLIDHTRSFYPFDDLLMEEQLTHIEAGLWKRLRTTSLDEVRAHMKKFLRKSELDALLHRWGRLVAHYQAAIESRGEERVLFELPR